MKRAIRTPERDRMLDKARKARYVANNPARAMYRHLASRAEKRDQSIMPMDHFVAWYDAEPKACAYCGMMSDEARERFKHKLHVDRKDCKGGYVAGNVCLACHRCNIVKSAYLTHDQMKDAARRYFLGDTGNAHDDLVAALREIDAVMCDWSKRPIDQGTDALRIARAALAKAGAL